MGVAKIMEAKPGQVMPRYWRPRRLALRDKHTHTLFYEDLVAAGVAAMWKAALKFEWESGYRF